MSGVQMASREDGRARAARTSTRPPWRRFMWPAVSAMPSESRHGRRHLHPITACSVLDAQAGSSSGEKGCGVRGQYWKGTGAEGGAEPASPSVTPALL